MISLVGRLVAVTVLSLFAAACVGVDERIYSVSSGIETSQKVDTRRPNIVLVMADDLGYAELGCYGQKHIRTPNIDRLAAEGMRFTQHYSGSPVCASSRCVLLTGKHTGHAYIRDNSEVGTWASFEGQTPLADSEVTIGECLKAVGYTTACIGKWGLGGVGSEGDPNRQGFDHFFGYNCQRHAHNYYPRYLWRNQEKVTIAGNERGRTGSQYAADLMADEALEFLDQHGREPFFLYYATPVPHAALQVPGDSSAEYAHLDTSPYDGKKGYLPHETPRAAYAGMVTRMDRDIGRMMDKLEELGVADNTVFIFTSDNGPTFNGGTDSAFFESAGVFRGLKCDVYEGGIRVPFVVRWPGHVAPGTVSDHVSASWDLLATFGETCRMPVPATDGVSMLPTLTGSGDQLPHGALYWEYARRKQAIRQGSIKAVRNRRGDPLEIYDLSVDPAESNDLASQRPELVGRMEAMLVSLRTPSELFPLHGSTRKKPAVSVKPSGSPALAKSAWTLVRASSESKFNDKTGDKVFDGDPGTWWHSEWRDQKSKPPHELEIDLGKVERIAGVRFLARQDGGKNGVIREFELIAIDGATRRTVAKGELDNSSKWQERRFEPVDARRIALRVLSEIKGRPFGSLAELELLPASE